MVLYEVRFVALFANSITSVAFRLRAIGTLTPAVYLILSVSLETIATCRTSLSPVWMLGTPFLHALSAAVFLLGHLAQGFTANTTHLNACYFSPPVFLAAGHGAEARLLTARHILLTAELADMLHLL